MKHNIHRLIILSAILFTAAGVNAQKIDKLHTEEGLFNHLSVGLSTGLTGTGIDVSMPVHKLVTIKAGFSGWGVGDIKFKAINTATEITQTQLAKELGVSKQSVSNWENNNIAPSVDMVRKIALDVLADLRK